MHRATQHGLFDELKKISMAKKIKGPDRMPRPTQANLQRFRQDLESLEEPDREQARALAHNVSDAELFTVLHSMRRWYSGQTMAHKLRQHREALRGAMNLEPEAAVGAFRGFKVPDNHELAQLQPGQRLALPVTRNRGLSSWTTSEKGADRFSGGGRGKTGLVVKLTNSEGIKPVLAPPEYTAPWFNNLYEKTIGRPYRTTEGEFLIEAPEVQVEVVKVKKR